MKTEGLQNDAYMTTEHRRDKKAKVSFAMVMNKILVGSLILTSLAGGATVPAQAASNKDTTLDVRLNISENYMQNPENYTYNTEYVLSQIQTMQKEGIVTNAILIELATELNSLSQAVSTSGKSASADVLAVVKKADSIMKTVVKTEENADGLAKAKAALIAFGALSVEIEAQTNVTLLATKANYPTTFNDVKSGSTYYTAVNYLAKKGVIGGYKDGNFKATTNITNAKFITMLMRAVNPKLSRATKGNDYSAAVMKEAFKIGVVKADELKSENYDKSITKKNMILWVSRALDYKGENVKVLLDVDNLVTDFNSITGEKYQDAVKEVYSAGIVTGKEFKQNNKVTRGSAATIIYKVANTKARTDMSKADIPTDNEAGQAKAAVTLKATDKNRGLAHIGDTWVAKDGKKTKITGITWGDTEIPAYGMNIDLYTGLTYGGGETTLKNGDEGGTWNGDSTYRGQPFTVAKDKTGKVFAYFRSQWKCIQQIEGKKADKVLNPKNGQMAPGCYFTQYDADLEMWVWIGPSV